MFVVCLVAGGGCGRSLLDYNMYFRMKLNQQNWYGNREYENFVFVVFVCVF